MDDLRYQVDLLTGLNQKLNNESRMYKLICETSNRVFLYINYVNNTVRTIGNWEQFFNVRINELSELSMITDFFKEEDRDEIRRLLYVEKEGISQLGAEACLSDGHTWLMAEATVYYDTENRLSDKIISFLDITKTKNHRDELTFLAYYDLLTNLYNRNYFLTKLKEFVDKAEKTNSIVSVILFDVDDFHKISDSRGLIVGDEIIQNIGLFLHDFCDANVIAARFDSDEFCIAVYDPCGHRSVDTIYRSIRDFLNNPIKLTDGSDISVSVSVGVAEYPEATENPLTLVNCAEIVMLKAKDKGKNNIEFFDTVILNNFLRDVSIENKMREAIHENKFFMNYQPMFYADSRKLRGVEALIRWKDQDGSFISPELFIPIAEKNGAIIPIGDYVLEESIRNFMVWNKKFDYEMVLSVNISSIQYNRPDFVPKVLNVINKYHMKPEFLEIEITESVLIDDLATMIAKMNEFRDYGIRVSLDDFGTGFSSLSYIKGLPIDTLKIDRTFVNNIVNDESAKIIMESVINMSKKLGFITVAEGVENKDQLDYLNSINCDIIQGFYLGKPMSPDSIEELLLRII